MAVEWEACQAGRSATPTSLTSPAQGLDLLQACRPEGRRNSSRPIPRDQLPVVAVGFLAKVGFALWLVVKGYLQSNPD
jgi:hypothetical protein